MRGYACIGLDNPKSPENVGGALRAISCYGAALLVMGGKRPARWLKHSTNTMKQHLHMPVLLVDDLKDAVPYNCVPVAVDIVDGARPLQEYVHPERAFYIFGGEDATLGERTLSWCRDVVVIPTKRCMNLAATVNVVLYDRMAKQSIIPTQTRRVISGITDGDEG